MRQSNEDAVMGGIMRYMLGCGIVGGMRQSRVWRWTAEDGVIRDEDAEGSRSGRKPEQGKNSGEYAQRVRCRWEAVRDRERHLSVHVTRKFEVAGMPRQVPAFGIAA